MGENIKKNIIIIGGPTGSGESVVTKMLLMRFPHFKRLITATTRSPRLNEKDEIDYFFFSEKEFLDLVKQNLIVEYTYMPSRNVYYGTYKPYLNELINKDYAIIINPDLIGTKYYKEKYNATTIFLKPESLDVIKKRLLLRQPDITQEELSKRTSEAEKELTDEVFYDYSIINYQGKLEETVEKIIDILKKEGYKLEL